MSLSSRSEGGGPKKVKKSAQPATTGQAKINWKDEEFHQLCRQMQFPSSWGATFPAPGSTAAEPPAGMISLYAHVFREGNIWLALTKFVGEVLKRNVIHVSQVGVIPIKMHIPTPKEKFCGLHKACTRLMLTDMSTLWALESMHIMCRSPIFYVTRWARTWGYVTRLISNTQIAQWKSWIKITITNINVRVFENIIHTDVSKDP
ncbi:hypothetical protein Hanom_Chr09g00808421 [Helianthus anomalus]